MSGTKTRFRAQDGAAVVLGWRWKAGAVGSLVGTLVLASSVVVQATSPLPTNAPVIYPAVTILVDTSGSMNDCDGGTVTPSVDFRPSTGGYYLYDPRYDTTNAGTTSAGGSTAAAGGCATSGAGDGSNVVDAAYAGGPTDSTSDRYVGSGGLTNPPTVNNLSFPVTRLEAVKLAVSNLLDADGSGVIDVADQSVLKIRLATAAFPDFSASSTMSKEWGMYSANGRGNAANTYYGPGTAFSTAWTSFLSTLSATGDTDTGPALAGTRKLGYEPCYDAATATACALPASEQTATGDDVNLSCRGYYTIVLTDGLPNTDVDDGSTDGNHDLGYDPLPIAKTLQATPGAKIRASQDATPLVPIYTVGIGFGATAQAWGTSARGVINCMSYWGGKSVDADADVDANEKTMGATTLIPQEETIAAQCDAMANLDSYTEANGNGYFSSSAGQLLAAFQRIINGILNGSYSLATPAINTSGVSNAQYVYGAFFDVVPNKLQYHGHLRKYRFDASTQSYVDCDDPTTTSNPVRNCWDAGGHATAYNPQTADSGTAEGTTPMLYDRDWTTRTVFMVDPGSASSKIVYDTNTTNELSLRPGGSISNLVGGTDVVNVVPLLNVAGIGGAPTSPTLSASASPLYRLVQISNIQTTPNTYPNDGTTAVSSGQVKDTLLNMLHAAGEPTVPYTDATLKCETATCSGTSAPKLGDSFHNAVVVVGPPQGFATDSSFQTYLSTQLEPTTSTYYWQGRYSGNEVVKDAPGFTSAADACTDPSYLTTSCVISHRRTMIYLASNDGMIHAFDDVTGGELWAFMPPYTQLKALSGATGLQAGRIITLDGPPLVRDVKFPCDSLTGTVCNAPGTGSNTNVEDGFWHTLLVYGTGQGGNYYLCVDVTNPVKPVFLWAYRDPLNMGLTIARPTIGTLPLSGSPTAANPGAAVFATGGIVPTTSTKQFYVLQPMNGTRLSSSNMNVGMASGYGLPSTSVVPTTAAPNAFTGEPRAVDSDLDGATDRVYFGDLQGRMWKACNLGANGSLGTAPVMWFDPALYDNTTAVGQPCSGVSGSTTPLTGGSCTYTAAVQTARRELRGPIFFAPDVTHNAGGQVTVAFGSGDMFGLLDGGTSPLVNPPTGNHNYLWEILDATGSGSGSCSVPAGNSCAAFTGSYTDTTSSTTFTHVKQLSKILTGEPQYIHSDLFYTEFDPNVTNAASSCSNTRESHLVGLDAFSCAAPASLPFGSGATASNSITFSNTLLTGMQINTQSGTIFVTQSVPGGQPPASQATNNLALTQAYTGWRELP